jgi:uncharacterized protein (DUF2147 family)
MESFSCMLMRGQFVIKGPWLQGTDLFLDSNLNLASCFLRKNPQPSIDRSPRLRFHQDMNVRSKLPLLLLGLLIIAPGLSATSTVLGNWRTIDDETGKKKSIVSLYLNEAGLLEGKVLEILHSDRGPNPLCEDCPGDKAGKPIKGMVIIWDMEPASPTEWRGGRILDPMNGKVYKAKISLREDGDLEVRGFIGFSLLGRTQIWKPD